MAIHSKEWIRVAAGPETYQKSLGCGMCLEITAKGVGSGNDPIVGKIKAVIVDECAGGCGKSKNEFVASSTEDTLFTIVAVMVFILLYNAKYPHDPGGGRGEASIQN